MQLQIIINTMFLGNSIFVYLQAFNIFLAVWIVLFLVYKIALKKITDFSLFTANKLDDLVVLVLGRLNWLFFTVVALNTATIVLNLNLWILRILWVISVLIVSIYIISIIRAIIGFWIENLSTKNDLILDSQQKSLFYLISLSTQILVWVMASILILQFLQIDVTALVGTLGIGGIAIAFALQSILSDVFASFSIYLDQPFGVGDFIQLGTDSGTVEKIGIKSTRIKTLQGEMLIVPNKELTGVRIQNFSHLERRRAKIKFNLDLKTTNEQLRLVSGAMEQIITDQENCIFERANFEGFSGYGLSFEVIYFIENSDYKVFMNIQEEISLALKDFLEKQKIIIVVPNSLVYLNS